MEYRKLGKTDIEVSVVALGCMAFVSDSTWGYQDEKDSYGAIAASLDSGINFFDTAESYGNGYSEELLGNALKGRRHEVVIASKVTKTNLKRDLLLQACEKSLSRLQTDYIDLYQIHWPNWDVPTDETIRALEELQQAGKIRAIGVCNYGVQDLAEVLPYNSVVCNQLPYSLLWRVIEKQLIPEIRANNLGLICYSSLAQGLLGGGYKSPEEFPQGRARTRLFAGTRSQATHGEPGFEQEVFATLRQIADICQDMGISMSDTAIAWLSSQEAVTSVLVSARNADQAVENAKSAKTRLPQEVIKKLTEITEELKGKIDNNPDPWLPKDRSRFR